MPDALIDRQEVERRLHVCERTVYRLVERGELVAHKVGNRLRFRTADVEAYLDGTRVAR